MLLVLACHYLFKLDSLTAFSIAVAYTMSLQNVVRRLFGRWLREHREKQQEHAVRHRGLYLAESLQ